MMLCHRLFHAGSQGQWVGRCRIGLRWGRARRAGTLTRCRRRVALTGTSNPPPSTPSSAITAPTSVEDLWHNLSTYATGNNDTDGVFIQIVRGPDQTNRLIVYLGGTTLDATDQAIWENLPAYLGVTTKSDQVDDINSVLQMCAASPSCGSIDEIMLVGYSQGGLDAQNLALWNALGGLTGQENRVPVTTVVTFGTPITSAGITPGVTTLNIQDQLDEVVDGVNVITSKIPVPWQVKLILAARAVAADLRGET
jgi:hypothetical protein